VSNAQNNNDDERRQRWRGIYDISAVYAMLCGDTAHLHKKVLPEVVLGEFHAAIRAPSQPGAKVEKRKQKSGDERGWYDVMCQQQQ
jgi:hypothetical protein